MKRIAGTLGLVGGLVAAGLVLVGGSVLVGWLTDAETSSYADWLSAIATVAALLAAVYAGVQGARALKIETDRDADRDEDERMGQARQVAVWAPGPVEWQGPLVTDRFEGDGTHTRTVGDEPVMPVKMQVAARNASGLPVFNLTADFYVRASWDSEWVLAVECPVSPVLLDDLPAGEVITQDLATEAGRVVGLLPGNFGADGPPDFAVGWSFTDAAGLRWTRGPGAPLRQVVRS